MADAPLSQAERERLREALTQRVEWARQALADANYSDAEKVWMRRYEMDVPIILRLLDALNDAEKEMNDWVEVLELCLPDDEGYHPDTAQTLGNVIESMKKLLSRLGAGRRGRVSDWFRTIWDSLAESERQRLRDKARWEHVSLRAVLVDWPSLAPEHLRPLVPLPNRDA